MENKILEQSDIDIIENFKQNNFEKFEEVNILEPTAQKILNFFFGKDLMFSIMKGLLPVKETIDLQITFKHLHKEDLSIEQWVTLEKSEFFEYFKYSDEVVYVPYLNIIKHYDEFEITNSKNLVHKIKDLFVYLIVPCKYVNSSIKFIGKKSSFTKIEVNKHYLHSHLPSRTPSEQFYSIPAFCTGDSEINMMIATLCSSIKEEKYERIEADIYAVWNFIDSFVRWESVEGVPYLYIKNLIVQRNSLIPNSQFVFLLMLCKSIVGRYLNYFKVRYLSAKRKYENYSSLHEISDLCRNYLLEKSSRDGTYLEYLGLNIDGEFKSLKELEQSPEEVLPVLDNEYIFFKNQKYYLNCYSDYNNESEINNEELIISPNLYYYVKKISELSCQKSWKNIHEKKTIAFIANNVE